MSAVARPRKPPTPKQRPPTAKPWAHAYTRRLVALHAAWSEHVIDYAKSSLIGRTDAYDPNEPRDERGEWKEAGAGAKKRPAYVQLRANYGKALQKVKELRQSHYRLTSSPHGLSPAEQRAANEIARDIRIHEARLKRHGKRLKEYRSGKASRTDAIQDDLLEMFGPLIEALGLNKFLRRMGHSITKAQANYLKRVANVPVSGVAPPAKLEAWRQQNLALIRSVGAEQVQQIGDILRPAQNMGLRWEDVADEIQARLDVGESRARLIARDQTNKWNGAMAQQTQSDAGITSYQWWTAGDLAVRGRPDGVYAKSKENHWALHGTIQRWDSPPLIPGTNEHSHPGGRIQCRCFPKPIVPWLDEGS